MSRYLTTSFYVALTLVAVQSFSPQPALTVVPSRIHSAKNIIDHARLSPRKYSSGQHLRFSSSGSPPPPPTPIKSDQIIVGTAGSLAALIVLYSEFILSQTGCGLPAGPFGLVGAAEGLSYLSVVGLVCYSLYTKIKTGSGLPAGPAGVLGAAEGLSFLAALFGIVVLVLQIGNYGYIPNAVPMEGGMCQ
mmetsp:Transcript_26571/g.32186  ORF Transcript_26571/g.32186 Transcript_26571/m.32186 type:complete len:190 (+) Transcript_26571:154-723(+)|eukprot:CAMPEP_0172506446 /NCGR_PEP_ID=MMETSP1066-20121228/195214_1 /TAXON_ID=671091 /ORGANISM="Coscinodiscus wailesii, Strain CCMP2513" /LENGTH=189 /DNA_ID=CAMNT_0013283487 /DNA_START=135 /DNA_END=704 /DNA_ORIENTATION=+